MNIRMNSKEVRFRLGQVEIADLLKLGSISEQVILPLETLNFKVQFDSIASVAQFEHNVIFSLSPVALEKLKLSNFTHEAIESVFAEHEGARVNYKLEIDVFSSKRRGEKA